ncbi:hypothetical protein JHJ32_15395 [Parapedobacter sp. ISTM3]|uniref:hypothetical protein n=1 Tax=Parapedobacter sp. ISTM3 TaxID=2800130 RepID=UPI001907D868|nr:hypothetical protein [Parapedobacter sp. ISTM3]MBK1441384.1 hypothetical protein [Parapedobacter sp. ISTM3]
MKKNKTTRMMIQVMVCLITILVCTVDLLAQAGKTNQVHVGIIYPLSTNGKTALVDTNRFSLHLISGVSQQEDACLITGVSGIVKGKAYGVAIAGVSNHITYAKGTQVAGMLNHIKDSAQGLQIAGLANLTGKEAKGVQIAGVINKAGDVTTQVAGLVNVAKRVKGVQVAGLINVAEASDYPIGILNFIKEGELQLGVTLDEAGSSLLTFRSGGNVLYGILGIGYNFKHEEARYILEGGIGAHLIAQKAFRLNAELASAAMTSFEDGIYNKQSFRALAGYRVVPGLELFAGPTFNHLLFEADQPAIRDDRYLWTHSGKDYFSGFFIGGIIGLQISL